METIMLVPFAFDGNVFFDRELVVDYDASVWNVKVIYDCLCTRIGYIDWRGNFVHHNKLGYAAIYQTADELLFFIKFEYGKCIGAYDRNHFPITPEETNELLEEFYSRE